MTGNKKITTTGPLPVPKAAAAWGATPLLDPHGVAVAAGGAVDTEDAVIAATFFDQDGKQRRDVKWTPPEGTTHVEVGVPRRVADTSTLIPAYAHDHSLHILRVGIDGKIITDDQLGGGWPQIGQPARSWVGVVPIGRDHYLVSWCQRPHGAAQTALYGPRSDRATWSVPARLVERAARHAVTMTVDENPMIAVHDALTGEPRWQVDARHRLVAGASRRLLAVVELTGHATAESATVQLERAFRSGSVSEEELASRLAEIQQDRNAPESTRMVAFSMDSGAMVWSTHVEGRVLDAFVSRDETWVWSATDASAQVTRFARTGRRTADFEVPLGVPPRGADGTPEHRILGVREGQIVLAGPGDLRVMDAAGETVAKTLLPAPCVGEHAVQDERLLPLPDVKVRNERVALRDGDRLWIMNLG